jgi:hypothetical protein
MSLQNSAADATPTASDMCDLVLRQAVDTLANWKCAQAIKAGKLRLAHDRQHTNGPVPAKFTPRFVRVVLSLT